MIVVIAAEMAPAVNESHYIPKARHLWDASFAPQDVFLQSHDSHYLASLVAGLPACWLSFTTVAWIGRFTSWLLMAFAWTRLSKALAIPTLVSPFALAAWYLAVRYGHWSGEWAIGGFEAKTLAYPFVLLGLAAACQGRWKSAWLLLATAVAWHPIVGGWAGLSVGIAWILMPGLPKRLREQWLALLAGIGVGCIGVLPAASGLQGENVVGNVVATAVHVFLRLPHHMSPQLFALERHYAAAVTLTSFIVVAGAYLLICRRATLKEPQPVEGEDVNGNDHNLPWQPQKLLLVIAAVSLVFAAIGVSIDFTMSKDYPATASRLLRFYWFRWADVAVPLASVALGIHVGQRLLRSDHDAAPKHEPSIIDGPNKVVAYVLAGIVVALTAAHVASSSSQIPAADKLLVESEGEIDRGSNRYIDWLAVCEWIRENTPEDSLWLTPKYQQTFKWHAQRAEVVCWKDVPQDNESVHEWFRRITDCEPPRNTAGRVRPWQSDEILRLAEKYNFEYVLIDRSTQQYPLKRLAIVYPTIDDGKYIDNRSFAIFRVVR